MTSAEFKVFHRPVMPEEVMTHLDLKPEGIYVDCTAGGGGHSSLILKDLNSQGRLICLDKDSDALKQTRKVLDMTDSEASYQTVKSDFSKIRQVLDDLNIDKVDGILADFGVSSHQLDENSRGFGYMRSGPLDMRMDREKELTAFEVVNKYDEKSLEKLIRNFGEERWAGRIAGAIVKARELERIDDTVQLSEIIKSALPAKVRRENRHPAKRTFQAIRIEVNAELESINALLEVFPECLKDGGRFVAISFHSLEDRIVKKAFKKYVNPCTCPKDFPVCVCGLKPLGKTITRGAIMASPQELMSNPRARSAKLRAFERRIKKDKGGGS